MMHYRTPYFFPAMLLAALSFTAPGGLAQQPRAAKPVLTDQQKLQQVEDSWSDAINKRDQYALELVLSPEFINIAANGDVTTRNQQISLLFQRGALPASLDQRVVTARIFGDMAIVNGTYTEQVRDNNQPIDRKGIFTHVYQRVRGNWLCVSAQRTPVIEQAEGKQKALKKASNAQLPFHIPLLHKGDDSKGDDSATPGSGGTAPPPAASSPTQPNP